MKKKLTSVLTWGFSVVPFFSTFFQAIMERNTIVLCSIYLGILLFLIIGLFISTFEIGLELLYILPTLIAILIPAIAIQIDLFKVRYKQRKIYRLEKRMNVLNSKLNSLKNK